MEAVETDPRIPAEPGFAFSLIGSGAVREHPERAGTCQVVRIGEESLLVDCGRRAVANLVRFGYQPEQFRTILISHLHFDHVCDLAQLLLLSWVRGRTEPLRFFGPAGLRDFLEYGVRRAYAEDIRSRLAHGKDPKGVEWEIIELEKDGPFLKENGVVISALKSAHAGMANYNYRFDTGTRSLVVTSDTEPDPRLAEFSRNADLLVVECSGTAEFLATQPWGAWHLTPEKIGELATHAGVGQVILKHLVIDSWCGDPGVLDQMAASVRNGFRGPVSVGFDGLYRILAKEPAGCSSVRASKKTESQKQESTRRRFGGLDS